MKWWMRLGMALLTTVLATGFARAEPARITAKEAAQIGVDAVVYGLPLVIMDTTRRVMTDVALPQTNGRAPINQFSNALKCPTAADRDFVRPNLDTLASSAWLDLSKEPIVVSVPNTNDRYYLMPLMDGWTDVFASIGKRTTGTGAGKYAIVGPHWNGDVPYDIGELRSPTDIVWILGQTQVNGPSDCTAVNQLQQQYKLTPLSAWGKPYTPPVGTIDSTIDTNTPPVDQVSKMDAATFFKTMAAAMKSNPPPPDRDTAVLAEIAKIGIVPGQDFDMSKVNPQIALGLEGSVKAALSMVRDTAGDLGKQVNGWTNPPQALGNYGTAYGLRAAVALVNLGAIVPADALYPTAFYDGSGHPLSGAFSYQLHFDQTKMPPVNAFWSVTMYNPQSFLVYNPLNRYNLASWMPLKYNFDGSLDIYIQKDSPGPDRESNWLPAPAGLFNLTMCLYWPGYDALDRDWYPPALVRQP
jgi:hypothetical protein